ncbi:hypothetical protein [Klebsiella quasipneumoniae]|uniref:hypothetical protein n=1 Tax=Klebsiella quasipneumoniae TaxID=1463165 RepID=UPI003EC9AC2E
MPSPPEKAFWLMTNLFHYCARIPAGWRLSPYPAYERRQYQPVMRLAVGPRKRSAAGQSLNGLMPSPPGKAFWLMTNLFHYCARISAGWRLSPYPAYERRQYQTVMRLAVGPRKRSAAG